jgi:hypothetical protein
MTDTTDTTAQADDGAQEPTDEQLRSDEARRYRQRLRDAEADNAQLVKDGIAREERLRAMEKMIVNSHLADRMVDPNNDFWSSADIDAIRDDNGVIDLAKVDAAADVLLQEHPHWRAPDPSAPLAAPSAVVNGAGRIGSRPSSALDGDNVQPEPVRSFGQFLSDASRG